MTAFEVVVRPVVLPNIRPAPAQSLPPQDDPDKGFAVIRGNGAKEIGLSNSYSSSTSSSKNKETQRRVDEARVYQMDDDGTINRDNFVDLQVANKIWMKGPSKGSPGFNGDDVAPTAPVPGRGFNGDDIVPKSKGGKADEVIINYYRPITEKENIEVKRRDVILPPSDQKVTP